MPTFKFREMRTREKREIKIHRENFNVYGNFGHLQLHELINYIIMRPQSGCRVIYIRESCMRS